ncbi:hypothetical protein [Nocardia jinanensis]|uniref:Uncharacterized protein n=1 Tax=Nocardia jinanensis TaxID=382504 RepID=A0A917RZB3_9NOCA|nr:hypothetical protein [Nocardia jinanensis]GGL44231.1 hypothetical protein GCM10011588_68680 [Nocardia jinanensis]
MSRERHFDIYVPVGPGAGVGVVGSIFALLGGVVVFAVIVCAAVSCADFGEGAQIPESSCEPFCAVTSAAHPAGEVAR